jgi:hypothetical protein
LKIALPAAPGDTAFSTSCMPESGKVTWEDLFAWLQDDWLNIACSCGASFAVLVMLSFFHSASAIVAYNDAIHHIYVAQTFY